MSKNIVLCSDGTGNSTIKGRGTNVFKLFEAVDVHGHRSDPALTPQVAFYDDGVGTERLRPLRLLTGALGLGLGRNVRELYAELARVYRPDDRIYLFGFSRGAFTVRTLAGLITHCGIVDGNECPSDEELRKRVSDAYEAYREKYWTDLSRWRLGEAARKVAADKAAAEFRSRYPVIHPVRIRFIGVWDTVDAVGLPIAHAADLINQVYPFKFPDQTLSDQVDQACHALSIDDERATFHPLMWDEAVDRPERIEQVWFAGVHANVGGGYPKQGMSLVALAWMMKRAADADLRFVAGDYDDYWDHQNVNDKLYDSRAGLAFYYRYKPRDIRAICEPHHVKPKIHLSAIERVLQGTDGYAPGSIPRDHVIVSTAPEPRDPDTAPISREIAGALGQDGSLLDRVRSWVRTRRVTYYATLVLSLLLVGVALDIERRASGLWSLAGKLFSVGGLASIAWGAVVNGGTVLGPMLVAVVLSVALGEIARRRIRRAVSEFWHQVARRLTAASVP